MIYKLFQCSPNIPSCFLRRLTHRKSVLLLLWNNYRIRLSKKGKFIVLSLSSFLFSSNSWDDATKQSQRLTEWMSTREKYFPCFYKTNIDQCSAAVLRNASSTDCRKHRKRFQLSSNLERKRNRFKMSKFNAMEKKFKHINIYNETNFWSRFFL